MDKIKWCAGKKEGLSLIEPNKQQKEILEELDILMPKKLGI